MSCRNWTVALLCTLCGACAPQGGGGLLEQLDPLDQPELPERGFYLGLLPVPAADQDEEEAFALAAQYSEFVPMDGDGVAFHQLAQQLAGSWGDSYLGEHTRGNGMFPLVQLSFFDEDLALVPAPCCASPSLDDERYREAWVEAAVAVVEAVQPAYLDLGCEANLWFEAYGADADHPSSFLNFVSLYEESYAAVKARSPSTMVFCSFAREQAGESREADMTALDLFEPDSQDLLVFSSQPWQLSGMALPEDIAADYYSGAAQRLSGPAFGFSEVSWPASDDLGGERAQADFLADLVGPLTTNAGLDLHLLGWPRLHDLDDQDRLGLLNHQGEARPAYESWQAISMAGEGER